MSDRKGDPAGSIWGDFAGAVTFLTRVPLPIPAATAGDLGRSVGWFPVVGLLVGGLVGGLTWAGSLVLPPLVAAALAVGIGALVTGAFHEDGLADTFDALGGGRDRDRALEIMRDSRLGTFGAAALVIGLVTKIAVLASLPGWLPVVAAAAAGALGRGAAVAVIGLSGSARTDGVGAAYLRTASSRRCLTGVAVALLLAVGLLGGVAVPAAVAAAGLSLAVARWSVRRLGGVTGDVLGAVAQLAELAVLVTLSAAVLHPLLPWR